MSDKAFTVPSFDGKDGGATQETPMEAVFGVEVEVRVQLGKTRMPLRQLLKLGRGAVIELDRKVGEAVDIYAQDRLVARGEIVISNDKLGVTMTEIIKDTL